MSHKSWGKTYSFWEAFSSGAGQSQAWGLCLPLPPSVIHLDWFSFCHQYPELLVASYNNNEDAPHEPDGVALVWNMKYKKATPEYVFHCQVPEATFFIFPPTLSLQSLSLRVVLTWQGWTAANPVPVYPTPLLPMQPLTPHRLHLFFVSSLCWHPPSPHLSANTCCWGAGEEPVVQELNRIQFLQQD